MVITLSILDMGGLFASGVTEGEMQRRKSAPPHAPINRFNLIRAFFPPLFLSQSWCTSQVDLVATLSVIHVVIEVRCPIVQLRRPGYLPEPPPRSRFSIMTYIAPGHFVASLLDRSFLNGAYYWTHDLDMRH